MGTERDPLGGVVVAADGEDRQLPVGQLGEEPVQQTNGFGGGHGFVVEVARQQNSIHGAGVEERQDLLQNIPLVVQHGELADPLAEVQVGEVKKTHGSTAFQLGCFYYKRPYPLSQTLRVCQLSRRASHWHAGQPLLDAERISYRKRKCSAVRANNICTAL